MNLRRTEIAQPITGKRHPVTKHKLCATTDGNDINSLGWWRKRHRNLKQQKKFVSWHKKHEVKNESKSFKKLNVQIRKTTELGIVPGNDLIT